jgi:hypothetical protein
MQVDVHSGIVRVWENNGVVCRIEAEEWSDHRDTPTVDAPVEETVVGRVTALRFPPGRVVTRDAGETDRSGVGGREASGLEGPIRIETAVTVVVAFEGTATLGVGPGGIEVSFPEDRDVALGLRRSGPGHDRTITVPGTAEGVAAALTYASVAHDTTTPVRSDPATRRNPPRIERGDAIDVPESIQSGRVDTGIELHVPSNRKSLFVLASLAYYLGARVSVETRDAPLLRAPDAGVCRKLSSLPELQADAASLLYRVVTLDCLLRDAHENPGGDSAGRLATAGIAPAAIADADVDERLAAYLDASFSAVESALPEWHLSVYVSPTPESVTALPYVLDRLAFVYLPDAEPLPGTERLQHSLADFYRARDDGPTVDPILPDLNRGRLHAWLDDGVAVDAFRLFPEAHANRRARPLAGSDPVEVTLVVNDAEMSAEMDAVRGICRDRSGDPGVDLCVEHRLDRGTLAATLREPTDLFYYIGHCDRSGLRCTDGHLDVASVDDSGADVFFLNACGSYEQGASMIEAGSIAGAVTLRPVLDGQAKRVGTAFMRLVIRGFAIARALRIASRRAIMNTDYAVVGDGTYGLARPDDVDRVLGRVTPVGERFRLQVEHGAAHATARYCRSYPGGGTCLSGSERRVSMSRDELSTFLQGLNAPVLYENRYYWAADLRQALLQDDLDP